jgi:succinate dehydrogenase / fumarate reductase membrane anchor subunit
MIGQRPNEMRTAARHVRGLGPAHSGTTTFWHLRVTSAAGVLLTAAFIIIVLALVGRSHAAVVQILGSPLVAILMLLFIVNTLYHMWLGMQEIVIDYVHEDNLKILALLGNTCFVFAVGFAAAFAILKLSFGV